MLKPLAVAAAKFSVRCTLLVALLAGGLPQTVAAQSSVWLDAPEVVARLAAREVIVRVDFGAQTQHIGAAILVEAPPEVIWRVLTDCAGAPAFIPGLKRCRVLEHAADGSQELIEREVKYSFVMPTVHSVVRADYQPPWRIDFHHISGDLKDEDGSWVLERAAGSEATRVEYRLDVDPGFWVPHALVRHSVRKEMPAALQAMRTRAEHLAVTPP